MAAAYASVGVPLVWGLWVFGAPPTHVLAVGLVVLSATAALAVRSNARWLGAYGSGVVPAVVCTLSADALPLGRDAFMTMMMGTVGLSSLHDGAQTVVISWVLCSAGWAYLLQGLGLPGLHQTMLLSLVYAIAAFILFQKAEGMRRLHAELVEKAVAAEAAGLAKSKFLATMSHELRTPLNGVVGMAAVASLGPLNREQREAIDTIQSSANWLIAIVSDVLDQAKLESGELKVVSSDYSPLDSAEEVSRLMSGAAHGKGLEVHLTHSAAVPGQLEGDSLRVRQVLCNLLSNAIKFTEVGSVHLHVDVVGARLLFRVSDTGIGIAPEAMGRIFEAFRQGDDSVTRRYGGTGLGLSLTRGLVKQMGGSMEVNSRQGLGSEFTVFLPLHKAKAALPVEGKVQRVRVVAADPRAAQSLTSTALAAGLEVVSGAEADIVLVDVPVGQSGLPSLDGAVPGGGVVAAVGPGRAGQLPAGWSSVSKPVTRTALRRVLAQARTPLVGPVATASPGALRARALIAEDNPVNAKVLSRLLEKLEVHCDVVVNGLEAVRQACTRTYDLVFLDLHMPVQDGVSAAQDMRRAGIAAPIIAVTASVITGERQQCFDAGMDGFITKPLRLSDLEALVTRFLRRAAQAPTLYSPRPSRPPFPH